MDVTSKSGFSLVEVMIASFLLAFGMLAIGWTMVVSGQMGKATRNRMEALNYARWEMEKLSGASYNDEVLDVGTHSINTNGYNGTYVVSEDVTGLKEFYVRIRYASGFQNFRWLELEGAVSDAIN